MPNADLIARHRVSLSGRLDAPQTMLFVNGLGTDQSAWDSVAAAFADEYRIVRFDNAGGGTDPAAFVPSRYLELGGYARDLVGIAKLLRLQDIVLVGHSMGAMIALLATLERPGLADRLILISASPRYLDAPGYVGGFDDEQLKALYRAVTTDYADWVRGFTRAAMANADRPQLADSFAASLRTIPRQHLLTILCSIFQSDHRADLARVDPPTLVIQSREDFAVPLPVAEHITRQIRHASLALIDACGHLPHISAPDEVIRAMRGFLGEPAAAATHAERAEQINPIMEE